MQSEAVRLAKIEAQKDLRKDLLALLSHPLYSVVVAFVLIEFLQGQKVNGVPLMGTISGGTLQAALISEGVIKSLAQSGVLDSLLPLLLTKGLAK